MSGFDAPPGGEAAEQRARRERIATAVLAGQVAFAGAVGSGSEKARRFIAEQAVRYADALIAELDR